MEHVNRIICTTFLFALAGGCPLWAQVAAHDDVPAPLADLQDPRIDEASGIAPSHRYAGWCYIHNDSGDKPRVYLVDRTGRTRATIRLKGAQASDYEDIAMAPGATPGAFDVCVADIGDNKERRPHVTVYRFSEAELPPQPSTTISVEPTAYRLRYADGPANAEAFAVHPRTGTAYVLTKRTDGRTNVYCWPAPWDAREVTVLQKLRTLDLPPGWPLARIVTAADIAPDGRRLAVRCYVDGWEWRLPPGDPVDRFDRVFNTTPRRLSLAPEPQGEALCYTANGGGLLTVSEGPTPTLYEVPARSPASQPRP